MDLGAAGEPWSRGDRGQFPQVALISQGIRKSDRVDAEALARLARLDPRLLSPSYAPELRISKAGDKTLRRLLVSAAHYVLGPFGPESDLRQWGLGLAGRGGKTARKRAIVATARKLSVLLLALWRSGQPYEPLRSPRQSAAPVAACA